MSSNQGHKLAGRNRGSFVEGIDITALSEGKMMELAILILQKPIVDRQHKEVELLRKYTENIKCFLDVIENLGNEAHAEMVQKMGFKALDAGVTLFEVGSIGYEFYMILKGRVEVWIKINKGYKPDGTQDFEMKKVAELETGKSFGELAIMEDAIKPRAATIIAKEDCYFGVLDRKTYKSILGKYHRLETFAKIHFLSEMPIFQGWTFHDLKSWVYLFEIKVKHKRKAVIYKEGDPADLIYLVKSGEVKVTKVTSLNYKPNEAAQLMLDDSKSLLVFEKDPIKKSVEIVTITPGHMFGEEEAWEAYKMDQEILRMALMEEKAAKKKEKDKKSDTSDSDTESSTTDHKKEETEKKDSPRKKLKIPTRVTTVTVQSYEAEIWAIPKKNFFAKLSQSVQSITTLLEIIATKKEFRNMRLKEIQSQVAENISMIRGNPRYENEDLQMRITAKKFLRNEKKEEIIYKGDVRYMDYITGTDSPNNRSVNNLNTTTYNTTVATKPHLTTQPTMDPITRPISPSKGGGIKYYDMPDFSTLRQNIPSSHGFETSDPSIQRTGADQNYWSHNNSISVTQYPGSPSSTIMGRETIKDTPQPTITKDLSIPIPKEVLIVDHPLNSNNEDNRLNMISSAKPKMIPKGTDEYITEKIADKMKVYHKIQENIEHAHKTTPHFFKLLAEPREKHIDIWKYALKLPTIEDKPDKGKAYDRDYIRRINQKDVDNELGALSPFQRTALKPKSKYQHLNTTTTTKNDRSQSFDFRAASRKDSISRDTITTNLPKPTISGFTGYKTTTEKFKNYYGTMTPQRPSTTFNATPKSNSRYKESSDNFVPVGMLTPANERSPPPEDSTIKVSLTPVDSPEKFLARAKAQIKKSMGYAPAMPVPRPPKRSVSADPPVNIHVQKLNETMSNTLYGFVKRRKQKLLEIEGKNVNMGQYIVKYRSKIGKERAMITDISLIEYSAERKKTDHNPSTLEISNANAINLEPVT